MKTCHLLAELEHKAYCATNFLNFDLKVMGENRLLKIDEIEECRFQDNENAKNYKGSVKRWHGLHVVPKGFVPNQQVLLYNSRLQLFLGKL